MNFNTQHCHILRIVVNLDYSNRWLHCRRARVGEGGVSTVQVTQTANYLDCGNSFDSLSCSSSQYGSRYGFVGYITVSEGSCRLTKRLSNASSACITFCLGKDMQGMCVLLSFKLLFRHSLGKAEFVPYLLMPRALNLSCSVEWK